MLSDIIAIFKDFFILFIVSIMGFFFFNMCYLVLHIYF